MVQRTTPSSQCSRLFFLLLFVACATASAILPSSPSSASGSLSANQRSARSTAGLLVSGSNAEREEGEMEEDGEEGERGNGAVPQDFVERFFRLLSGPVGKEAEALVAAVVKLLAEDDRVNWRAMADTLPIPPSSSSSLLRDPFHPAKRGSYRRAQPEFNPTGWRRRRSADSDKETLQRILRALVTRYAAQRRAADSAALLRLVKDVRVGPGSEELNAMKRDNGLLQRRVPRLKPKRKPLEFNPTGW